MSSCYICSNEHIFEITYTDSLGHKHSEKRCNVCADELESNHRNTVLSKINKSEEDDEENTLYSTQNSIQYRGKIHKGTKHPDLIKSNNILL